MNPKCMVIGHRGAAQEAPENTLEGFAYLRSIGINQTELDVRLTADDQLVVIHDETVDRTTHGTGRVADLTLAELKTLQASKHFTAEWSSAATIPSLEEILTEWPKLTHIQLEVKPAPKAAVETIGKHIATLLDRLDLIGRAWTTSSDQYYLKWMQNNFPNVQRGFVAYDTNGTEWAISEETGCSLLCPEWIMIDSAFMGTAKSRRLPISAWTVNDVSTASALKALGVHSIITDCPSTMIKANI